MAADGLSRSKTSSQGFSYRELDQLGRVKLSKNFYFREFLHSEVASYFGVCNYPVYPELAIDAGRKLCDEVLEPLQKKFGRIHIRSGYRSPELNALCNQKGLGCKRNEDNYARHIWDFKDIKGRAGAMACIVIPRLTLETNRISSPENLKCWVFENLLVSELVFFKMPGCMNIGWKL